MIVRKNLRGVVLSWLLVMALAFPQHGWAWGNTGHEAVAFVAWQQMTPATQKRAMQLIMMVPTLKSPSGKPIPGFNDWVKDLPPGLSQDQKNLFLFMRAATWPDSIKHQGFHDSDIPPAHSGPTDPIIGFTDPATHGYWHFVDAGFASDSSQVPTTPVPNAATQIGALRTAIASSDSDPLKAYELAWLEHLVGDVHQPLHGTARFFMGQGDEGGNKVKIKLPAAMKKQFEGTLAASAPTELHAFWDDLPGEGQPAPALPVAATFAKALPAATSGLSDTDPSHWAMESLALAKKDAYHAPIGDGPTPSGGGSYTITQAYFDTAMQDAKDRIALAGARLAKLLNENLH